MNPDDGSIDHLDRVILNAAHNGELGYIAASDEWTVTSAGLGTAVMPDFMQDKAHRLVEAGFLPEFEEYM